MLLDVKIEQKAIEAYKKRKIQKLLIVRRKTLENRLTKILYVLVCIFSMLCAYNLGLSHSVF